MVYDDLVGTTDVGKSLDTVSQVIVRSLTGVALPNPPRRIGRASGGCSIHR